MPRFSLIRWRLRDPPFSCLWRAYNVAARLSEIINYLPKFNINENLIKNVALIKNVFSSSTQEAPANVCQGRHRFFGVIYTSKEKFSLSKRKNSPASSLQRSVCLGRISFILRFAKRTSWAKRSLGQKINYTSSRRQEKRAKENVFWNGERKLCLQLSYLFPGPGVGSTRDLCRKLFALHRRGDFLLQFSNFCNEWEGGVLRSFDSMHKLAIQGY